MPLDPAAFLELAASCAPGVAPATLMAVARVESGLDPLAIGVNGGGRRPAPRTPEEAVAAARRLIAARRDIDLGLGQINVRNLGWLGLTLAEAFDPCRNLSAAARVLADGYRRAARRHTHEPLRMSAALSYYNTGHPRRGLANGYVAKVLAAAAETDLPPARLQITVSSAPDPPPWDVFGQARRREAASLQRPSPAPSPGDQS
ncbi:lytic transglycosylase domain-containing protein [Phenylobacterium sp.]|jgi:type IV secretion system protein VirB1|uniref:lytic transglycosylase domain-containing protein n=1 Tax=Phenylobacterium sp. TaxID=1871053 RepID=UPI002F93994B